MEKTSKINQLMALAVGVVTPTILLAGYVYYLGYITPFGLDNSLINRTISESVTESWVLGIRLVPFIVHAWILMLAFVVALSVLYLIFVYYVVYKNPDFIIEDITKENPGRSIAGLSLWIWKNYFGALFETFSPIGFVVVATALLILLLALPFAQGQEIANKHISALNENGCESMEKNTSSPNCYYLIDNTSSTENKVLAKGLFVTANSSHIAIFTGEKLEVWPLLDSYKIERKYTPPSK